MTSIACLSGLLKRLLVNEANALAREMGLIQRQRIFTGASLAQLLVLGWMNKPEGGPSELARFAGSLGLRISKQGIDERFTMQTGQWLLALLRRGVQFLVCAQSVSIPLLRRFRAVLVEDGSTITLPAVLKTVWKGCGGSGPEAALKLTVRWDLLAGGMQGPYLQQGRSHETQSPLRVQQMERGSLWIGDLGYFALVWMGQLVKQGVYFLMGFKEPVVVWNQQGERVDVLDLMPRELEQVQDITVFLGASKQITARLIATTAPEHVVKKRREQLQVRAHKKCKPINPHSWALAQWSILVTNVPVAMLSVPEAIALMRARWQIELLWKLWKSLSLVDEWQTARPERILCEVYAKLLGVLVQHWLLLLCCWEDPHRSLVGAAHAIREQLPILVHGLLARIPLGKALRLLKASVAAGCSIPARQDRPSTSRLLLKPSG